MSETTNSTISRPALLEQLKSEKPARSAWGRGIQAAAVEIVEGVDYIDELPASYKPFERALLGGARDWSQYSWGGCSLCCNVEIAERYMTPSGLKRYMAPGHKSKRGFRRRAASRHAGPRPTGRVPPRLPRRGVDRIGERPRPSNENAP